MGALLAAAIAALALAAQIFFIAVAVYTIGCIVDAIRSRISRLNARKATVLSHEEMDSLLDELENHNSEVAAGMRAKLGADSKMTLFEVNNGFDVRGLQANDGTVDEIPQGANFLANGDYIVYNEYGQGMYYNRNGNYLGLVN